MIKDPKQAFEEIERLGLLDEVIERCMKAYSVDVVGGLIEAAPCDRFRVRHGEKAPWTVWSRWELFEYSCRNGLLPDASVVCAGLGELLDLLWDKAYWMEKVETVEVQIHRLSLQASEHGEYLREVLDLASSVRNQVVRNRDARRRLVVDCAEFPIVEEDAGQKSDVNQALDLMTDLAQIQFANQCGQGSGCVMLSGLAGTGKTRAFCLAAKRLAGEGKRVLLVSKTMDSLQYQTTVLKRLGNGPKIEAGRFDNVLQVGEGQIVLLTATAVPTLRGTEFHAALVDDADALSLAGMLHLWNAMGYLLRLEPRLKVLCVQDCFGLRDAGLFDELNVAGFETTVWNKVVASNPEYLLNGPSLLLQELLAKREPVSVPDEGDGQRSDGTEKGLDFGFELPAWPVMCRALSVVKQSTVAMAKNSGLSCEFCAHLKYWLRHMTGARTGRELLKFSVGDLRDIVKAGLYDRRESAEVSESIVSEIADLGKPSVEVVGRPAAEVVTADPEKLAVVEKKIALPTLGEPTKYQFVGASLVDVVKAVRAGMCGRLPVRVLAQLNSCIREHPVLADLDWGRRRLEIWADGYKLTMLESSN